MMLNLQYHNLRDKQPNHNRSIQYYVLKGDISNSVDLIPHETVVSHEWFNDSHGAMEYKYNHRDSNSKAGDIKYFTDTTIEFEKGMWCREECEVKGDKYTLCIVDGQGSTIFPFTAKEEDNADLEIAWNYTHIIDRTICKATNKGDSFFPCSQLWELLQETEDVEVYHVLDKSLVGKEGNQYYQIKLLIGYNNQLFLLSCSQLGSWPKDAWSTPTNQEECDAFLFTHLGQKEISDV